MVDPFGSIVSSYKLPLNQRKDMKIVIQHVGAQVAHWPAACGSIGQRSPCSGEHRPDRRGEDMNYACGQEIVNIWIFRCWGKMNLSIKGHCWRGLSISQFTLHADTKKLSIQPLLGCSAGVMQFLWYLQSCTAGGAIRIRFLGQTCRWTS